MNGRIRWEYVGKRTGRRMEKDKEVQMDCSGSESVIERLCMVAQKKKCKLKY